MTVSSTARLVRVKNLPSLPALVAINPATGKLTYAAAAATGGGGGGGGRGLPAGLPTIAGSGDLVAVDAATGLTSR